MKIILIGATGFIGKHLFHHLKSKHHQVVVVSRNTAKAQKFFRIIRTLPNGTGKMNRRLQLSSKSQEL